MHQYYSKTKSQEETIQKFHPILFSLGFHSPRDYQYIRLYDFFHTKHFSFLKDRALRNAIRLYMTEFIEQVTGKLVSSEQIRNLFERRRSTSAVLPWDSLTEAQYLIQNELNDMSRKKL